MLKRSVATLGASVLLAVAMTGCGGGTTATPSRPTAPAASFPILKVNGGGSILHGSADDVCTGTTYSRCVDSVATAIRAGWTRFAICEYGNGEGDVVLLDAGANAENECSGGAAISPSRVFHVVELP